MLDLVERSLKCHQEEFVYAEVCRERRKLEEQEKIQRDREVERKVEVERSDEK